MSSKRSLLCFSSTDWDGVWGSRQQVMLRFARRGWQVLFIEQPAGLEHLARYPELRRRKLRGWREGVRRIAENLWAASLPPLLPGRYYSIRINHFNQWLTAAWTRPFLSRLNLEPALLWLYNPEQGPLVGRFGERLSVYHCIDEFTAGTTGRKRQTIAALETELLRRVDLVFANSAPTFESKRRVNPNTHRVPSGADTEHFARSLDHDLPEHPALDGIPHPRLGYIGNLNERLDYALLEYVACQRPGWSLVLIGEPYPWTMAAAPLQRLKKLPNCHLMGRFPFAELPALLKGLDVTLLPYASGESAFYRSPLKLYEYLAAGKPVVSVDHPEARELRPWVSLSPTHETFLHNVETLLRQENPQRQAERRAAAQEHSWDRRVDEMEKHIHAALET